MKMKLLALALALSTGIAALPAHANDTPGALFDAAVAGGLPQTLVLPGDDGINQTIVVTERMDADIDTEDGSDAVIYVAQVDGRPATILRLGDEMDIAFDDAQHMKARDGRRVRRSLLGVEEGTMLDDVFGHDTEDFTDLYSHADGQAKGVHVWLFVHDQAGETSYAKVLNWYASWWVKDMRNTVTPDVPVRVSVRSHVPGLTDLAYHEGTHRARSVDLVTAGSAYAKAHGEPVNGLTKFVLLVDQPGRNWERGWSGFSYPDIHTAMITNRAHRDVLAHEVGHLLGATHENGEVRPFCKTNMAPEVWLMACQVYTKANDQLIRDYVEKRMWGASP